MPNVTVGATSAPFDVDIGQTVTVTPGSGGTMLVEYTTDGEVAIRNGSATWQAWTAGTVVSATSDVCLYPMYARVTAYTASGVYTVTGSGNVDIPNSYIAWKRDVVSARNTSSAAAVVGAARPPGGTAYIMGDSLGVNNWTGTTATFVPVQNAGTHEMANSLAGYPLDIIGNVSVGATNLSQQIDTQLPQVLAARPQYCFISAGTNDIYLEGVSAAVAFARMQSLVAALINVGIIPIYSTIWARSYDATYTPRHLAYNDLLRAWVYSGAPGIFWDGFAATVDPASTQCAIRSGYTYDSAPSLHVNNVGALILGKACAAQALSKLPRRQRFAYGAEDATNTGNTSNLLTNPIFAGSGGTAGANVSGTVPTGWTVDWATRTGTGTAVASIVDITDADTGNANAKAIQVVVSGSPAAADVLRITQTGFEAQTPAGAVVNSECMIEYAGTIGGVNGVMQRVQTNANESAWWGIDSFTSLAYPQGFIASTRTRNVTSTGGGTARFDARFKFSGAGTPTFRLWLPRVRKVS